MSTENTPEVKEENQTIEVDKLIEIQSTTNEDIKDLNESINEFVDYVKEKDEQEIIEKEEKELQQEEEKELGSRQIETYENEVIPTLVDIKNELIEVNENQESIILSQELINENMLENHTGNIEGFWLLAIVIVLASGFKIFFENTLKW